MVLGTISITKDFEVRIKLLVNLGYTVINHFTNEKHKNIYIIETLEGYKLKNEFYKIVKLNTNNRQLFNKTNPYALSNIDKWLENHNIKVKRISHKYISATIKMDWLCLKCNSKFKATWNDISSNKLCSYCAGKKANNTNCIATVYPELLSEWNYQKNIISPYEITYGSAKKVWWICAKGHEWEALISTRSNNHGCPYCAGEKATDEYNLEVCAPQLIEEWDFDKNKLLPRYFLPNSSQKVWWKCKNCGHSWRAIISTRYRMYVGCPRCNKSHGEKEILDWLSTNNISYIQQKRFKNLKGIGNGLLSYDFYLPTYNILIEYQGEQHYHFRKGMYFLKTEADFQKQQEHDRRKREYAKDHNIKLLEIWYWDFNNIRKILYEYIYITNRAFYEKKGKLLMLFRLSKSSCYFDESDSPPCEEAIWLKYTRVDERSVDSHDKLNMRCDKDDWFKNGSNHRVENGHIKRDFEYEGWFIEIDSLETLIGFVKQYGDIVVSKCYSNPDLTEIEIYDTYRE